MFADVKPHERKAVLAAFVTVGAIMTSHALLETARDALFLARLPASQLPWVYLGIAAVGVLFAQSRFARAARGEGLALAMVLFSGITAAFGLVDLQVHPWTLYALYIWSGVVASVVLTLFWLLMSSAYAMTAAKRLFGVVGTGSILGAIAGSALARVMSEWLDDQHLILAAAATLAFAAVGPLLMQRAHGRELHGRSVATSPAMGICLKTIGTHPYTQRLVALTIVSTCTLTLLDFVFKSVVADKVSANELAPVFATLNIAVNVGSLVAQLLITRWALQRLGVTRTLTIMPVMVALGAAGVVFGGGLIAALAMKGTDGTLRHSLHRTGSELLFVPLTDALRRATKTFVDLMGHRASQALASIAVLVLVGPLEMNYHGLAAIIAVLALVWATLALQLRKHYLDLFRDTLEQGAIRSRGDIPALDMNSLEVLLQTLNSTDDEQVLASLELLRIQDRVQLVPDLLLYHPSRTVVLTALTLFADDKDKTSFFPIAERLLSHEDVKVRSAALRVLLARQYNPGLVATALADESALVRTTALVGAVHASEDSTKAVVEINHIANGDDPEAHIALALAISSQPSPVFTQALVAMAHSSSNSVGREVAHAMEKSPDPAFVPALMSMLSGRAKRGSARSTLLAIGPPALSALSAALSDSKVALSIRHHIPRTISRFEAHLAAPLLVRHLAEDHSGVIKFKILRGLGRLKRSNPSLELDRTIIESALQESVIAAFRALHWRLLFSQGTKPSTLPRQDTAPPTTPGSDLILDLLTDHESKAIERVFRLLGLQHPSEDFEQYHRGIASRNARAQASTRELLSGIVAGPMREPILRLLDDRSDRERLQGASTLFEVDEVDLPVVLQRMINQSGESLQCAVAYYIGECRLVEMRDHLTLLAKSDSDFVRDSAAHGLAMLDEPETERVAYVQ